MNPPCPVPGCTTVATTTVLVHLAPGQASQVPLCFAHCLDVTGLIERTLRLPVGTWRAAA